MIALALALAGVIAAPKPVGASKPAGAPKAAATSKSMPAAPIDFGAATMTLEPKENKTRLDGAVFFDRKDVKVTGDHAVAEFAETAAAPKPPPKTRKGAKAAKATRPGPAEGETHQTLSRFIVEGAVHVEKPGAQARSADGSHATYDAPKGTLVLVGPPSVQPAGLTATGPVLRDGAEVMLGERVLLHLETDEIEVLKPRIFLKRSLPGDGAAKESAKAAPPIPVRVEAGTLRLDQQHKLARFREKVVIYRGDLTVRSPRMDARYDGQGQLTTLELRGGVVMVDGDRRATGQRADYDAGTKLLVLTGEPKLYDRGDVLRGTRIEMNLESREVKVDRASGRVRPDQHRDEGGLLGKPAAGAPGAAK